MTSDVPSGLSWAGAEERKSVTVGRASQDGRGPSRRGTLGRIGAIGTATVLLSGTAANDASAQPEPAREGLPVLPVNADWQEVLATTPQIQLVPGAVYTLRRSVELPDHCFIAGNGAVVTVSDDHTGALTVTGKKDVTISDVRFLGRSEDPVDTGPVFPHVGVAISRSFDVRVSRCDFRNWRGAGLTVTGSVDDDYFAYRTRLSGNTFDRCYFGASLADRSEYSSLAGNAFTYCRLAIWNSSGNWTINDNSVVGCYGAYYSIGATSPYGEQPRDNWGHGSVVGNTFNHANNGGKAYWSAGVAFPVGGADSDPGTGVVVSGILPPTFTGNTLWYSDVRADNLVGTRWLLSGCTLSNLTVSCTGSVPVHLVGTQANGSRSTPVLTGNVKDLLPMA